MNEAQLRGINLRKLETERFSHINHQLTMIKHYQNVSRYWNYVHNLSDVLASDHEISKARAKVLVELQREEQSTMTNDEITAALAAITKAQDYLDRYQTICIVGQNYLANKMSAEVALENIIRVIGDSK